MPDFQFSDHHSFTVSDIPALDLGESDAGILQVDTSRCSREPQLEESEDENIATGDLPSLETWFDLPPEQTKNVTQSSDLNVNSSANMRAYPNQR